jgi:hypothetical protein
MGQNNSSETTKAVEQINTMVNDSVLEVSQKSATSLNAQNLVDLSCTSTPAENIALTQALSTCTDSALKYNKDPSVLCPPENYKACVFSDIDQSQIITLSATAQMDNDTFNKFQTALDAKMEEASKKTSDSFGNALEKVAGAAGSDSSKNSAKSTLKNEIKNSMSLKVAQDVQNNFKATNAVTGSGASFSIKRVKQAQNLKIVADAMLANKSLSDAGAVLDASTKKTEEETKKGLTDIVDSIGGVFKSLGMSWILVIGAVILAIIIGVVIMFMSPAGQQSAINASTAFAAQSGGKVRLPKLGLKMKST